MTRRKLKTFKLKKQTKTKNPPKFTNEIQRPHLPLEKNKMKTPKVIKRKLKTKDVKPIK
jgi:hypothetical protein